MFSRIWLRDYEMWAFMSVTMHLVRSSLCRILNLFPLHNLKMRSHQRGVTFPLNRSRVGVEEVKRKIKTKLFPSSYSFNSLVGFRIS